jgi:hypothetical protein
MKLLIPVTIKHAHIKKITVKTVQSLWINEEFKNCKVETEEVKGMENVWLHSRMANIL